MNPPVLIQIKINVVETTGSKSSFTTMLSYTYILLFATIQASMNANIDVDGDLKHTISSPGSNT